MHGQVVGRIRRPLIEEIDEAAGDGGWYRSGHFMLAPTTDFTTWVPGDRYSAASWESGGLTSDYATEICFTKALGCGTGHVRLKHRSFFNFLIYGCVAGITCRWLMIERLWRADK